tara:strand:+ start:555 stop:1154 length:600 start_codon:yes stop_codon:yes gene_type:complete
VTNRKKNILLIQILIFITAILLIYYTYGNKQKQHYQKVSSTITKEEEKDKQDKTQSNVFTDVEYKGVDLQGNRYEIRSEKATFEVKKPELIDMKVMSAIFYFKDGTILKVRGDYGTYNNKNNNMKFRENIIVEYKDDLLFSDNLDFLSAEDSLTIYGNVRAESIKGTMAADKLKFDLLKQTLDISMFDDKRVNVKLSDY